MTRITTDPIGLQPTASIPFGHMADLELGSDFWCFSNISAISWRPVLVVEEARVPGQPPTIGKQLVNFIIRVYGIKYKIFHRFSRNFFSGTAEGIELKSGVYVPMNVFNMCCYCLCHLKIQNGHQQRSKFALKPYGKEVVSADRTKNNNKMAKLSN
jgi:hypothetical protein